ncbi:MAG: PAS domain S-box protein, partial [Methanoregula sp.]|nr:PAS domain S-box protein [Methanoregula sp.]
MKTATDTHVTHILLIEDDKAHQDLVLRAFRDDPEPYRLSVAANLREARLITERDLPDLILADWVLPDGKGLEILMRRDGAVTIPLIIMTSYGDEHLAVEIMKSGAIDYVVKSATMFAELPRIIKRALRDWENIQERKRAEEAVQDTHKRLADILSFLPDAVLAIDNDGRVIAWNDAMARMTGVPAAEMLGKGDYEYSLPFYGERRPILIDLVLMDNAEIEKKYDYIQRDGDRITSETYIKAIFGGKGAYLWGTATPLYDNAGNRNGAIEVIRDITERKQNEELRRQREATLETLLNAPKDTIALLDPQGIILGINDEGARRLGGTVQTVTGRCAYDLLPSDLAPVRKAKIDCVFKTGKQVQFDDERSGTYLHNEIYPILNPERTAVERIAIFARDITDQKRAEQALQESETRFKELFNNIGAGVAIYEATPDREDFIIRDVNRAVETIEQVRKDEIVGRRLLELFPGVAEFGLFAVFQRVAETGIPESHPVSMYHDGRISGWRENYVYRLPSGEVVALYEDVTEKKQAEEAEQETRRKYAELFELGSEAIFLIENETGAILEANTAACEMYGYSREALFSMKNTDLSAEHEETHKVTVGTAQGTILIPLRYHRRNDGTVFPVEIIGRFFTWNNRQVHIAAIRDITSRIQAEAVLRESEERYRLLFDSIDEGFCVIEMIFDENEKPIDYLFLEINPSFEKQTGIIDAQGRRMREIAPNHEEHWFEIYGKIAL